jgi:hypothetical protein
MTTTPTVQAVAHPSPATIAAHLAAAHRNTGITVDDIAAATPAELIAWHEVDHRLCSPGFLGHTHTADHKAPAIVHTDPDRRIHADILKTIAAGGTVPGLEAILQRAAAASARRAAARHNADGTRNPGAGRLSQPDLDALEIAKAVADRAAHRSRKGRAA